LTVVLSEVALVPRARNAAAVHVPAFLPAVPVNGRELGLDLRPHAGRPRPLVGAASPLDADPQPKVVSDFSDRKTVRQIDQKLRWMALS